jgi:hypothetical protein
MHRWNLLPLAVFPLLLATSAQAGDTRSKNERAARKACLAGDYAKGISILSDLFMDTSDPTYIYNQGRCLEQNGRFADAILRFQEYLRVNRRLSESESVETRKHIRDCQEQLAKPDGLVASGAAPPDPETAVPGVPQPTTSTTAIQPPPTAILAQTNPSPTQAQAGTASGSGIRTAGIVTAAAGGAALAAGILLNLKTNGIAASFKDRGGFTPDKESDRKTYEALAWVGYGVGAACIATGAVLYFVGRTPRAGDSSALVIQPAFGNGEVGAVLKGSF